MDIYVHQICPSTAAADCQDMVCRRPFCSNPYRFLMVCCHGWSAWKVRGFFMSTSRNSANLIADSNRRWNSASELMRLFFRFVCTARMLARVLKRSVLTACSFSDNGFIRAKTWFTIGRLTRNSLVFSECNRLAALTLMESVLDWLCGLWKSGSNEAAYKCFVFHSDAVVLQVNLAFPRARARVCVCVCVCVKLLINYYTISVPRTMDFYIIQKSMRGQVPPPPRIRCTNRPFGHQRRHTKLVSACIVYEMPFHWFSISCAGIHRATVT